MVPHSLQSPTNAQWRQEQKDMRQKQRSSKSLTSWCSYLRSRRKGNTSVLSFLCDVLRLCLLLYNDDVLLCGISNADYVAPLAGSCNHCCTIHRMARHFCCRDTVICWHNAMFVQSKCYAAHGFFWKFRVIIPDTLSWLNTLHVVCVSKKKHKYTCNVVYVHIVLKRNTLYIVL